MDIEGRMKNKNISIILAVFFPFLLNAQNIVRASIAVKEITVDGKLTEKSWHEAEKVENFIQVEPDPGKPAVNRTRVEVLYNSDFLYFGGICYVHNNGEEIRVPDLKRDFVVAESDAFGIILDLLNDKRNATAFFINPLAVQRDEMVFNETVSDVNWNTKWFAETQICDTCWIFEIAIPWSSIRYLPGTKSIGMNFVRLDRTSNELSAWIPYPRTFSMFRLQYSGVLQGIKPPNPDKEIRFTPYLLMQNNLDRNDLSEKSGNVDHNKLKPGGDLKWAISSNTVLDLTLNTDFAQANSDRDIINLTSYDISLPEQRQFFLENAGLFNAGDVDGNINPFFSRRIGLNDEGRSVPMDGGLRLVHRGSKKSYGILSSLTHIPDSTKNFFLVGRYTQNYSEQNKIGLLTTYRRDNFSSGNKNNLVSAVDGFIRFNDNLLLKWMASGSALSSKNENGAYGFSQATFINYLTETLHLYFKNYLISENYKPEIGFISTNNIAAFEAGTDLYLRPEWKPQYLRSIEPGFYITNNRNLNDGTLRQFYLTVWPVYLLFQNGMVISAKWLPTWENLNEDFQPASDINILRGKYFYDRYEFEFKSDPSSPFNYSFVYSTGSYFNGKLDKLTSVIKFTPIPNISFALNYEPNWLRGVGEGSKNKKIEIISTELNLALNSKLGLTSFYQYNSEDGSSFSSIRFSWEYSPLSYLFILFNSNNSNNPLGTNVQQSQLLIKFSHQFQF